MKQKLLSILLFTFFTSFLFPNISFSQMASEEDVKHGLPKMLGASNSGQEFWFTVPPCFEDESAGYQNLVKIYVTSSVKTDVTVEIPGKSVYVTKTAIPYEVLTFDLFPDKAQPYTKTGGAPNVVEKVWSGSGIHVFSDQPVIVYCVAKYHYTSDGFLCLPTSALGKEYICAGYKVDAMFRAVWSYKLPSTCGITAAYNDTKVRVTVGGNSVTKTAGDQKPGDSREWVLQRGDVLMYSTDSDEADLSGTKIASSKPVSVVTGNMCANIPTGNQWCDYTAEMDLPTFTWGTELHVPMIPNRRYASLIRIFAKEPNTKIYRDGKQIGFLKYGGGVEGEAFLEMRMVPMDQKPRSVVISGDKPVNVVLYNCSTQEDATNVFSDPFVMAITPVEQYRNDAIFATPTTNKAADFPNNYINLVYQTDEFGMMPDDLMFGEYIAGTIYWSKAKTKFTGVDELFTYDKDNKKFAMKTIILPHSGVFRIKANNPFAIYSLGFSDYDSYGYPATAGLMDNVSIDTIPPKPNYILQCNGVVIGSVTDMPDDQTVRSNLAMINMNVSTSYNFDFNYDPFIPGETRTTTWQLKIIDSQKPAQAEITFADRRGNDTTIIIKYEPAILTLSTPNLNFGLHSIGETIDTLISLKNESTRALRVSMINLKSNDKGFALTGIPSLPFLLQPNESVNIRVKFTPTKKGTFTDSLGVGDTCIFAYKTRLIGQVAGPVIEVSDIDFGIEFTKNTRQMQAYIKNIGSTPLTIFSFEGPTLPVFSTNIPALPMQINPYQMVTITVSFAPTSPGNYQDKITFKSDADGIDSVLVINGNSIVNSIDDELSKSITISPVPADNLLTINTNETDLIKSIEVYDIKMRLLNSFKSGNPQNIREINIAEYPTGTYYLILDTTKGKVCKKFTIKR